MWCYLRAAEMGRTNSRRNATTSNSSCCASQHGPDDRFRSKAAVRALRRHGCFAPNSGSAVQYEARPLGANNGHRATRLFNYLVRERKQFGWHVETKCPGRLKVDDKLELGSLL